MSLRRLARAWWPPALLMAVIHIQSSFVFSVGVVRFPGQDKAAHLLVFALLGFLCARAVARGHASASPRLAALIATPIALAVLTGLADEAHQSFVPGRQCDLFDAAADLVGAALGTLAYVAARRRTKGAQHAAATARDKPGLPPDGLDRAHGHGRG